MGACVAMATLPPSKTATASRRGRPLTFAAPTLFAEFREEAEAGHGRAGEDDGVLPTDVLAQLLGHQAVELRLVLQRSQPV